MRLWSSIVSEKLKTVRMAEETGNQAARRGSDVREACIRDWRKKKDLLMETASN